MNHSAGATPVLGLTPLLGSTLFARTRTIRQILATAATAVALFFVNTTTAHAHQTKVGNLQLVHPFAPASNQGAKNGAVFFETVKNNGDSADELLSATSTVAERVELHIMRMEGEVMRMREVKTIELPAKQAVDFKRGKGYHLMLMGLKAPLKEGDKFPVKLVFKNAGPVEITVKVENAKYGVDHLGHKHSEHKH